MGYLTEEFMQRYEKEKTAGLKKTYRAQARRQIAKDTIGMLTQVMQIARASKQPKPPISFPTIGATLTSVDKTGDIARDEEYKQKMLNLKAAGVAGQAGLVPTGGATTEDFLKGGVEFGPGPETETAKDKINREKLKFRYEEDYEPYYEVESSGKKVRKYDVDLTKLDKDVDFYKWDRVRPEVKASRVHLGEMYDANPEDWVKVDRNDPFALEASVGGKLIYLKEAVKVEEPARVTESEKKRELLVGKVEGWLGDRKATAGKLVKGKVVESNLEKQSREEVREIVEREMVGQEMTEKMTDLLYTYASDDDLQALKVVGFLKSRSAERQDYYEAIMDLVGRFGITAKEARERLYKKMGLPSPRD